jgi:hypothetical protein
MSSAIMHYKKVKKHKRKVMIKIHYRLGKMLKESKRLKKELFVESPT